MPQVPTGGPPDATPPALESTTPEAGAVNVTEASVRLTFSEYVDEGSFTRALSISPTIDGPIDVRWRRRRAEIRLPKPLRENTTYVITLDNNLRDLNNVALKQPIILAFSTGPEINKGRLVGRVIDALQGNGVSGFDVYAYAAPDSTLPTTLPDSPDYRTQTDDTGQFQFSYLSEQPYFVIALRDRNRNRLPDANEAFAVPPYPAIRADSVEGSQPLSWLTTVRDTVPPVLQRVRARSSRRLVLRFSESIRLTSLPPDDWMLTDSLTQQPVTIHHAYVLPNDPRQVFLMTDSLGASTYQLRPAAVADSSGNAVRPDTLLFTASSDPDTLRLRFTGFAPERSTPTEVGLYPLPPAGVPGARFNQSLDSTLLSTIITVQDTLQEAFDFTPTSPDGVTYHLQLTPALQPGQVAQVRVDGQRLSGIDTVYTRLFQRVSGRDLGGLSGVVTTDTSGTIIVELYATGSQTQSRLYATTQADTTGVFLFDNVPEGSYRFRAFVDYTGDGYWDGGQILPYRSSEPLVHVEAPSWRARWESALADTLRIPVR